MKDRLQKLIMTVWIESAPVKAAIPDAATDISAAKDGKPTSTWFIRVLLIVLGAAAVIGASIAAVIIRKKRTN